MKGLIFLHYYAGGPSSIRPSIMSLTCERSARYYENLLVSSHDSVDRVHARGWLGDLLGGHQRSVKIFDFHLHVAKQRRHIVGPGATTRWGGASGPLLLSETRQVRGSVSAFEYGIRPMGSFKEDSEMMVLLGENNQSWLQDPPLQNPHTQHSLRISASLCDVTSKRAQL